MSELLYIDMKKKNNYQSPFGQRLRQIRQARGYSQVELGKRVGLSQRMMGHYEKHVQAPPVQMVAKLAQALKVSTDELLGTKPCQDAEFAKSRNLMRRFQKIESLPLRDKRTVFSLINALQSKQSSKKFSNGSH
jgi:transcriptional regulator with XRE-family HTH domain